MGGWTKWNKKMGGRSFVITCGVIGTLYCAAGLFVRVYNKIKKLGKIWDI